MYADICMCTRLCLYGWGREEESTNTKKCQKILWAVAAVTESDAQMKITPVIAYIRSEAFSKISHR